MRRFIVAFATAVAGLIPLETGFPILKPSQHPSVNIALAVEGGITQAPGSRLEDDLCPSPLTNFGADIWCLESPVQSAEMTNDTDIVVQGNNAFALDLYAQLLNTQGNLFFSPYSISTALAMTYAGARSQTATQMANVLHFTLEPDRLHPAFRELISTLNVGNQQGFQISIANRLWGQQGYGFLDDFVQLTEQNYGASLEEVDFVGATEKARQTINHWVEQQTEQKIKNLIPQGILNEFTRLVLTNAIYFQGNWQSPFSPEETKPGLFTIAPGQQVNVPMMYQQSVVGSYSLRYGKADGVELLVLPYEGLKLSMVILLPEKVDGLAEIEGQLTPENLKKWMMSVYEYQEKYQYEDAGGTPSIKVWLPKFNLTSNFELKQILSQMGMAIAFNETADFSGMNRNPQNLYIQEVIHKAFVDVNEKGTEAAASTGVMGGSRGATDELIFRADHPFIFLIQDDQSGSILFLGRMVNPLE